MSLNLEMLLEQAYEQGASDARDEKPAKATKKSKKTKASNKPKLDRVEIAGHPTRATWTDAMRQASDVAYKALLDSGEGVWSDWNRAGLLAAQQVA